MKFKTFFQRRSNSSVADSDPLPTTTKRKKKETKSLTTKSEGMTTTSTTTNNTFMTVAVATSKEKCASCPVAAAEGMPSLAFHNNHNHQPQPDESGDSILFGCENCGGCATQKEPGAGVTEVVKMKLTSESSTNEEEADQTMDKEESGDYKSLFLESQSKIKELTNDLTKMREENEKKNEELQDMNRDFLLCIRGAERFRFEAEKKAVKLDREVARLRQELAMLKSNSCDEDDFGDEVSYATTTTSTDQAVDAASINVPTTYNETKEAKKIPADGSMLVLEDSKKVQNVLNEGVCTRRTEKLSILRQKIGGSVRNGVLNWCKERVQGYPGVEITNFSSSWTNGLALAALIHSLIPDAFDYNVLNSSCPVENFETALKAGEKLGVDAELDVLKLISSENPPWELMFAYTTEVYLAVTN